MPNNDGDGEGGLYYVTYKECKANIEHMKSDLLTIKEGTRGNSETINRILKILQGNGDGGLIWKVNMLVLRSQWVSIAFTSATSVFLTLLTLYLRGALHL